MKYFLIVERPENWAADSKTGFVQFGLPKSKRRLGEQLQSGDVLITYISGGISAISDCRLVTHGGLKHNEALANYDDFFPFLIRTSPVTVLPRNKWIGFKSLTSKLDLTRNSGDWRQMVRISMRPLSGEDGLLLVKELELAERDTTNFGGSG
jgi:hypothetical protein